MSLDFDITKVKKVTVYSGNMTHNVTNMWAKAGIYDDLYNSEGKKAGDIIENLKNGLSKMKSFPAIYEKLNPENGWGSYESSITFLEEIIIACEQNPDGIIRISK